MKYVKRQKKTKKTKKQKGNCFMFDKPILWFTSTWINNCQMLLWGVTRSLDERCNILLGSVSLHQKWEVAQGQRGFSFMLAPYWNRHFYHYLGRIDS
jgi:hypothetical protein